MEKRLLSCPWCGEETEVILNDWQALSSETKLSCSYCNNASAHTPVGIAKIHGGNKWISIIKFFDWFNILLAGIILVIAFLDIQKDFMMILAIFFVFIFLIESFVVAKITGVLAIKGPIYKDLNPKLFENSLGACSIFAFILGVTLIVQVYLKFFAEQ